MHKSLSFLLLSACCLSLPTFADPYVGYIYPAGIQAGTTNRFLVGGQKLPPRGGFHFSGTGLHVLDIEPVPNFPNPPGLQRQHLTRWLDRIAAGDLTEPPLPNDPHLSEWRSNRWWSALGTLDAGKRALVERDLFTPRNALQASPSLRQMMLVTIAADADAPSGVRFFSAWGGTGMSVPRPFVVTPGRHVAEPLYTPPHRTRPEAPFVDARTGECHLDGQIMPGQTDVFRLRLAGGRAYAFNVTARELQPYIGDAVPGFFNPQLALKDKRGKVVATADDAARFRPDPVLAFTPPADGEYALEIHDVLYRGRADFVYTVRVGDPLPAQTMKPDGVVDHPGAVSSKTVTIEAPGPRVFEVTARRRGSPLDAVLTLRDKANGAVLARWDDQTNQVVVGTIPQGGYDPIGTFDFQKAGEYVAEISDRTGHGGPEYGWWLDVRAPKPGFSVYSTRSTLPLRPDKPLKVGFRIQRQDGFTGAVTLEFPNVVSASNTVAVAGTNELVCTLMPGWERMPLPETVEVFARAEVNGATVRVPVQPCDEYEQAFAWHHLVPAEAFLCHSPAGRKAPGRKWKQGKKKRPR